MSSYHKVFVYGTLKGNEPNHHRLMDKKNGRATFVDTAKTVQRFPLVIASRYNIPYLLAVEGTGENVQGEIYEVDDVMLGTLDFLEAHPKYYERKIKKVTLEDSNKTIDAWVYLLHKYKPHMLDLPFLKSYESEGSHNMKYVARYQRPITGSAYWIDVKHV